MIGINCQYVSPKAASAVTFTVLITLYNPTVAASAFNKASFLISLVLVGNLSVLQLLRLGYLLISLGIQGHINP